MQWSCDRFVLISLIGFLWSHDVPAFISPQPSGTIATVLSHPPGIRTCSLKGLCQVLLLLCLTRTWRFVPPSAAQITSAPHLKPFRDFPVYQRKPNKLNLPARLIRMHRWHLLFPLPTTLLTPFRLASQSTYYLTAAPVLPANDSLYDFLLSSWSKITLFHLHACLFTCFCFPH